MLNNTKQTGTEHVGVIVYQNKPDTNLYITPSDKDNSGKYFTFLFSENVNTLESEDHDANGGAIRLRNKINRYRYGPSRARRNKKNKENFGSGMYGSYLPIQAGSLVKVNFPENDKKNGNIIEITTDQENNNLPFKLSQEDRDELYLLLKTPKYDNIINCVTEESISQNCNSIHNYFNIENKDSVADNNMFGGTDESTGPKTAIRTKYIINSSQYTSGENVNYGGLNKRSSR